MSSSPASPAAHNIHASCVAIGARGVIILGTSGTGKSDLALRLIDRGATLVADDRCELWVHAGRLMCRPPPALAGMIEARGIGILQREWTAPVPIAIAIRLSDRYERLPDSDGFEMIAETRVPAVKLAAFELSAAIKVEAALDRLSQAS